MKKTRFTIFAVPKFPLKMINFNLCNSKAFKMSENWNETMQVTINFDCFHYISLIRFQSTIKIMNFYARLKPRYHIKFDTGMTRLGVDIEKADLFYKKLVYFLPNFT